MGLLNSPAFGKRCVRFVLFTPVLCAITLALWAYDEPHDLKRALRQLWNGDA